MNEEHDQKLKNVATVALGFAHGLVTTMEGEDGPDTQRHTVIVLRRETIRIASEGHVMPPGDGEALIR